MTIVADKFVKVEPIKSQFLIGGWRLIMPSGSIMFATTKREADSVANLINEELAFALQQIKTEVS